MGKLKEITSEDDFQDAIDSAGDKLVVADFWAAWCGPCRLIGPAFERMSDEDIFDGVIFLKVDVDEVGDLAEEWGIQVMPTFVFIKNGEKIDEMAGANKDILREMITKLKD